MKHAFCLLVWFFLTNATAFGVQESKPRESLTWLQTLATQTKTCSCYVNLNGTFIFNSYPPDRDKQFDVRDFFLSPEIVKELELTEAKKKSLKAAFRDFQTKTQRRTRDRQTQTDAADESKKTRDVTSQEIRELQETLARNIEKILSKKESRRLKQLQLRCLMHQHGFLQTYQKAPVQNEFGIRIKATPEMLKQQYKIAKQIWRDDRKIAAEAIEIFLDGLNDEQIEMIKRRWRETFRGSFTCPSQQFLLQFDPDLPRPKRFQAKKPFDYLSSQPSIDISVLGNCIIKKSDKAKKEMSELYKYRWLSHLFRSAHFKRDIELVDSQLEELREITQEWSKVSLAINHEIGKKHNIKPRNLGFGDHVRIVYTIADPDHLKDYENALEKDAGLFFERLHGVLVPHQRKLLMEVNRGIHTRFNGPLADILWGDLGKLLDLDKSQKESLKKNAAKARKHIETESRKTYENAMEELVQLVPSDEQKQVKSTLGNIPKNWTPNLNGFATALSRRPQKPPR